MSKLRWLQLSLAASLAINLVVAGFLLGKRSDRVPPLRWATEQLDEETRSVIEPLMRERIRTTMIMRRDLRKTQQAIHELMTESALDEAALNNALATLRTLSSEYQRVMHDTAVAIMARLEPEQRLQVAGRLLAPHREGRPPNRDRPHPSDQIPLDSH